MEKLKSSELEDRLSELPDSLILHILEFLPITDVVRTTILSHSWKNLWTTIPCLILNSKDDIDSVRGFVNAVLKSWRGIKIFKFVVDFWSNDASSSDIDSWVLFAKRNEVIEFYLHLTASIRTYENYLVPKYLYSCSSLKQLSIKGCAFRIEGGVQWNQLKSLSIDCYEISENDVSQIFSGCPQLEVFFLFVLQNNDNLSIRSSSLKVLSITKPNYEDADDDIDSTDSELRIWTPNLETLQMLGGPYIKCSLMNVSSLTRANLGFYRPYFCQHDSCAWDDVFGETLRQIFPAIQRVENITLSDQCIKVLGAVKDKYMVSPFPNVKILQLNGYLKEYEQILNLLEMFPKLKMLVLEAEEKNDPIRAHHAEISLKFERDLPKSILLQLRTVEFSWMKSDVAFFPLTESLPQWYFSREKVESASG